MQSINPVRIFLKTILIFSIINLGFGFLPPSFESLSLYNHLFPGRLRFPFPSNSTDVSVDNLDALFSSHVISNQKANNEYRVIVLGDSSVWGAILTTEQTISEKLNDMHMVCNGKNVHVYNLGYPHPSLTKDFLILDSAIQHQPDKVLWMVTLNALNDSKGTQFLDDNREHIALLAQKLKDGIGYSYSSYTQEELFWNHTLLGRRSDLARYINLQVHSFYWNEISHTPQVDNTYRPPLNDLVVAKKNPQPFQDNWSLRAGDVYKIAKNIPVIIVNEPMFIASGQNSDISYNSIYLRKDYDYYRQSMALVAARQNWNYVDVWNAIPSDNFLDTPLHLSPKGEDLFAKILAPVILDSCR